MTLKGLLFVALGGFTLFYAFIFWKAWRAGLPRAERPTPLGLAIGFVTNFFDTLGIGSFATTTAIFRSALIRYAVGWLLLLAGLLIAGALAVGPFGLYELQPDIGAAMLLPAFLVVPGWLLVSKGPRGDTTMVDDRLIPGTLNVGHTLPTITQAFIYIAIVEVDILTLIALIVASVAGASLGAGVVAKWPAQKVRIGMGLALLAAAGLMLWRLLIGDPAGVGASALTGTTLALGVAGNFMLGALMTIGIGLYAPCMILISLLGLNPRLAFPIMMGSCAFLMPAASAPFLRAKSVDAQACLGLALGGIPGTLIAAFIVKSLPLDAVRWLVIVVVVYTGLTMLHAARKARLEAP